MLRWTDELYLRISDPDLVVRDGVQIAETKIPRRAALRVALRIIVSAIRPDRGSYRW